jgi:hypothetical protein
MFILLLLCSEREGSDFQVKNSTITLLMKNYSDSDVFKVCSHFETVRLPIHVIALTKQHIIITPVLSQGLHL